MLLLMFCHNVWCSIGLDKDLESLQDTLSEDERKELERLRRFVAPTNRRPLELGGHGVAGPVGMPGLRGPNKDGTPGDSEEERRQRWRDNIAHNERYFAKYPQDATTGPNRTA
jgi:hypothetical protein